ncbi:unnamed protein product [Fusarium graminearum]|nr:unnamed protein product [Fusarium graminearum]
MSRLPAPSSVSIGGGGLTEWSESQHNARIASTASSLSALKNLKREIPQPAAQSDPKRKPLSERALEYSSKPTSYASGAATTRSGVRPQSLAGMSSGNHPSTAPTRPFEPTSRSKSGDETLLLSANRIHPTLPAQRLLKQPSTTQSRLGAATSMGFNKATQNGRYGTATATTTRVNGVNGVNGRPTHTRSKSQAPRPRTAHAIREEQRQEPPANNAWDVDGRVVDMESQFKELKEMVNTTLIERKGHDDALELAKKRVNELESEREKLNIRNDTLKSDLDSAREEGRHIRHEMDKQKWEFERQMDDLERKHREKMDDMSRQYRTATEELKRELDRLKEEQTKDHEQKVESLTRLYHQELSEERQKKDREIQDLRTRMGNEHQDMGVAIQRKDRELQEANSKVENLEGDLQRERTLKSTLQTSIAELSAANTTLEAKINSLKSHVEFLESDNKAQSDSFANMEARLQEALRIAEEAQNKLIKEETERRVLFNKYQELKGNIRVMCRVRPPLGNGEGEEAKMSFPDDKTSSEIVLAGPEEKSSLGQITRKNYPFEFDRVFIPGTQNQEIFGEISQLVQSALDGYNVCIFCYGQTGSGKTHTMSSSDGMIPRATHMIYDTITKLKEKSWEYTMEGSFVEVYNEELNDLLTPNDRAAARKLEIRHDEVRKQTTITNCQSVRLDTPSAVEMMLEEAQNNRSVAATKANERSSRSHSIFILKLIGENSATGERCEGTLNLVDLAGSERLKHSQAEGDRMKETQNINKSLSCLGDVIEALGRGSGHIPYRNSKLTHLLQYSLGGNSKTLMFVMVSPLETHLKETLTSLRFATKVCAQHSYWYGQGDQKGARFNIGRPIDRLSIGTVKKKWIMELCVFVAFELSHQDSVEQGVQRLKCWTAKKSGLSITHGPFRSLSRYTSSRLIQLIQHHQLYIMSGSTGLKGSIWATGGRSRLQGSVPSARASSQPSSRPTPPLPSVSAPLPSSISTPAPLSSSIPSSTPAPSSTPTPAPLPSSIPASTHLPSSAPSSSRLTSSQAFHRFEQACLRLRWKFADLKNSYERALHPEKFGFSAGDAEKNFKVDFHEFYAWIEQAIVLLLLVFNIEISSKRFGMGMKQQHRYHEEVITTLEDAKCPLYEALGSGEVNMALRKAKELRNRWKDAGEGKETPPLKMYDLTWLVGQVLAGLEVGYAIGAKKVETDNQGRSWADDFDDEMVMAVDDEWDWMVEPMEWESVS